VVLNLIRRLYFRHSFAIVRFCVARLLSLLLLVFVDALQHTIHLLLQQQLELFDHEFVDRAPLHEVGDQALNRVALVHDDALDAEVCHVDINVELGFALFTAGCQLLLQRLVSRLLAAELLLVLDRRGDCMVRRHRHLSVRGSVFNRLLLLLLLLVLLYLVFGLLESVCNRFLIIGEHMLDLLLGLQVIDLVVLLDHLLGR